eukprot:gnl/MRDRNA2_/MRDRNA2_33490_c0_seq1.p1 gnl/MRDRNA2_/MRDRNA2_33490_c0~~gnl/MRDRNA2_/MRDRNA2_33490_c0_seq1.p1  ORF type:complete len:555 (+),score=162.55 gnl/MRDRNA2_/MRDRNA2_33490_c0_seq1:199-1665(+)
MEEKEQMIRAELGSRENFSLKQFQEIWSAGTLERQLCDGIATMSSCITGKLGLSIEEIFEILDIDDDNMFHAVDFAPIMRMLAKLSRENSAIVDSLHLDTCKDQEKGEGGLYSSEEKECISISLEVRNQLIRDLNDLFDLSCPQQEECDDAKIAKMLRGKKFQKAMEQAASKPDSDGMPDPLFMANDAEIAIHLLDVESVGKVAKKNFVPMVRAMTRISLENSGNSDKGGKPDEIAAAFPNKEQVDRHTFNLLWTMDLENRICGQRENGVCLSKIGFLPDTIFDVLDVDDDGLCWAKDFVPILRMMSLLASLKFPGKIGAERGADRQDRDTTLITDLEAVYESVNQAESIQSVQGGDGGKKQGAGEQEQQNQSENGQKSQAEDRGVDVRKLSKILCEQKFKDTIQSKCQMDKYVMTGKCEVVLKLLDIDKTGRVKKEDFVPIVRGLSRLRFQEGAMLAPANTTKSKAYPEQFSLVPAAVVMLLLVFAM